MHYEAAAAVFGIASVAGLLQDAIASFFCDNAGTNGTIIRGPNKIAIWRSMASAFRNMALAIGIVVSVEYVRQRLNHADPPPRVRPVLGGRQFSSVDVHLLGVPKLRYEISAPYDSVFPAQFKLPTVERRFIYGRPCATGKSGVPECMWLVWIGDYYIALGAFSLIRDAPSFGQLEFDGDLGSAHMVRFRKRVSDLHG